MVRLASGSSPIGLKSAQQFLPELRLLTRVDEEALVALPLTKDSHIVSLPVAAMIKLQPVSNIETVSNMKEVTRLVERALNQMTELADRILVHDVNIGREAIKLDPEKTVTGPRVSVPSSHQPAPGN